jgi:hypothetical protein
MICVLRADGNLYNWPLPVVHFVLCMLSKMLKLCGAESLKLFVTEVASCFCKDAVSRLFLRQHLWFAHWSFSFQMVSLQWLKPSVSAFPLWRSDVVVVRRVLSNATCLMLSHMI